MSGRGLFRPLVWGGISLIVVCLLGLGFQYSSIRLQLDLRWLRSRAVDRDWEYSDLSRTLAIRHRVLRMGNNAEPALWNEFITRANDVHGVQLLDLLGNGNVAPYYATDLVGEIRGSSWSMRQSICWHLQYRLGLNIPYRETDAMEARRQLFLRLHEHGLPVQLSRDDIVFPMDYYLAWVHTRSPDTTTALWDARLEYACAEWEAWAHAAPAGDPAAWERYRRAFMLRYLRSQRHDERFLAAMDLEIYTSWRVSDPWALWWLDDARSSAVADNYMQWLTTNGIVPNNSPTLLHNRDAEHEK